MSPGALAWTAVVVGSLLWALDAASRARGNPPRARARRGEKGWWPQQGVYVAGYFLILLGLFGLQQAQGWRAFVLALLVWLVPLALIGLVHRRRARRASRR